MAMVMEVRPVAFDNAAAKAARQEARQLGS